MNGAVTLFCYTSLDPRAARAAVDAIRAARAVDLERDCIPTEPEFLGQVHEELVREYTAASSQTVFNVRLTNRSALSEDSFSALLRALKHGFPDLLILFENELRV